MRCATAFPASSGVRCVSPSPAARKYFNCDKLFAAGIWPITDATTILKPGGYNRLLQMVEKVEPMPYKPFDGTDTQAICDMSTASHTDVHHVKPIKPLPSRKSEKNVPWIDCFTAPCKGGCPIAQHIPEYMELCNKGLYGPALKLITREKPPAVPDRHHLRPSLSDQVLPQLL